MSDEGLKSKKSKPFKYILTYWKIVVLLFVRWSSILNSQYLHTTLNSDFKFVIQFGFTNLVTNYSD